MRLRLAIVVLCVAFFSGCASSFVRIGSMSPAELQSVQETQLCSADHYSGNGKIVNEITRRKLITESQWASVKSKRIAVGMTRCAVLAAFGNPPMVIGNPVGGPNDLEALIYPVGTTSDHIAYYIDNGMVTKIDRSH